MKDPCTFHKIDFFRVALQNRGAAPKEIDVILAGLPKLARSKEEFDKWNRKLDARETQLLGFMLTPKGKPLSLEFLQNFSNQIATQFKISSEEVE